MGKVLMRRKIMSILAIAATAVTALLVVAGPAQADIRRNCFGYTGNFKSGTRMEYADWNSDSTPDECFGIAPNRTIWHAWPHSGGWFEMPNDGRADNVVGSFRAIVGSPGYAHKVIVRVTGGADYYSWLWESRNDGWYGWSQCTPSKCS
jgi:hypothetical protein